MNYNKQQAILDMEERMAKLVQRQQAQLRASQPPILPVKVEEPIEQVRILDIKLDDQPIAGHWPSSKVDAQPIKQTKPKIKKPKPPVNYRVIIGQIVLALVLAAAVVEMWFILSR